MTDVRGILKPSGGITRSRSESKYVEFDVDNEEDASLSFAQNLADVVLRVQVVQGEAFVCETGLWRGAHPNFELQLIGKNTLRMRMFRFRVFRDYFNKHVKHSGVFKVLPALILFSPAVCLPNSGFATRAKFPKTVRSHSKS